MGWGSRNDRWLYSLGELCIIHPQNRGVSKVGAYYSMTQQSRAARSGLFLRMSAAPPSFPGVWPSSTWSKVAHSAPHSSQLEERASKAPPFLIGLASGFTRYFCSHLNGYNVVTCPHLAAREPEKCGLYSGWLCALLKIQVFITLRERGCGYWGTFYSQQSQNWDPR